MGRKVYIIRRKKNSKCWDDQPMDKENFVSVCPCTELDWECDFGYMYSKDKKECVPIEPKYEIDKRKPTNCNGWYMQSTGFRKVPGNMCSGGVDKGPQKIDCDKDKKIKDIKAEVEWALEDKIREKVTKEIGSIKDK